MKKILITATMLAVLAVSGQYAAMAQPANNSAQGQTRGNRLNESIRTDLGRLFDFLNNNTPAKLVNRNDNSEVTDMKKIDANTVFARGRFGLVTYEWGVTYSGMLKAAAILGEQRYADYVNERMQLIGEAFPYCKTVQDAGTNSALRGLIVPMWLDDCGSMEAAMVKAVLANPQLATVMRPVINSAFDFVMYKEHRLDDGALARLRPTTNSVWVDDMYMGIPPIAYMGKLLEKEDPAMSRKCYDEAVKQVLLFKKRLWIEDKLLFRHSWIESMSYHPSLFWARANGWATLTMCDVLDILPADHPGRQQVMDLLIDHLHGIMAVQGGDGFWHQLLDRYDSYTETSATAIFTYCLAHAVNEGWVDLQAYGPAAQAGWKAVATRINAQGEVEGTCVGTGVAYEPGFYYNRPTSVNAAHGYGPVLLAGCEVFKMMASQPRFY
ncbi:MAG: glycoside hydrolase family 88 protein [Bacteroidales bacterium]|nr:glycoside hydrolase family 88 protein [Bacteroidales bacterium]